ncbi:PLP-dependent aminotransferase family protein [Brevibacillus panacihumi]|uniref:MocR-like pyridoxine biosynthesis transcription factor PdxR n=1 Tax=Brevibacillus panacihumi TaxID=497735 RepID=UPI003D1AB095
MPDISPHLVDGSEPLYLQLYRYFSLEIREQRLPSGTRLPSVRTLSDFLQVSKTTVESAYHQLLAEGYIESRERSGFFVVDATWYGPVLQKKRREPESSLPAAVPVQYNFHQASIDPDHFPFALWKKYSNQCMREENKELLRYGDRQGEPELRLELARYLRQARGVQASPEQIVIGAGTQVMITLLGYLFGLRGQAVAMEEPGYQGVRKVFLNLGFDVKPIPLEADGIHIEKLRESGAGLVYITPSHQDPTGIVMPYAKRLRLLQWAAQTESYIIEDDYDGEFRYHGRPIPSLRGLDAAGRVIYMGTFSKSLLPAIRISYMVLPPSLLALYHEHLAEYDQTASRIHQQTLALFMKTGDWERHIRKMRTLYKKKHDALLHLLREEMGEAIRITGQDAGISVMVEVRSRCDAQTLTELAAAAGIRVYPTDHKWMRLIDHDFPSFQFGFGGQTIEEMEAGIRLLGEVWRPTLLSADKGKGRQR